MMTPKQSAPFTTYYSLLKPLFDLYDENDYESAKILAKQCMQEATDNKIAMLLHILELHFEGYSRWDSSYDYSSAKAVLQEAIDLTNQKLSLFSDAEQQFFQALNTLHKILIFAIDAENCLISTDPSAMEKISSSIVELAEKGIKLLNSFSKDEGTCALWLQDTLSSWKIYHVGVKAYSYTMSLFRTPAFAKEYAKAEKTILESLELLKEIEDEEFYTELHSYYTFLKRHYDLALSHPKYLVLKNNELNWLFSFWVEEQCLNKIYDKIIENTPSFLQTMLSINESLIINNVDEERLSDLFETVLGSERMRNLIMQLPSINFEYKGKIIELDLFVRIFRYGIGTITFHTEWDELTVSELRTILSFSGPHSAQYKISWQNKSYLYLSEIANDLIELLQTTFQTIDSHAEIRFYPHLCWYAYTYNKRGIWSRDGLENSLLTIEEAKSYPDYNGLLLLQREVRAALDDWISARPSETKNLAPIRSHIQDFLVATENHGILMFLDDPKWIIAQYVESLETLIRLKCLILTLITISGEILSSFVQETTDLAVEIDTLSLEIAEKRIDETRRHLLPVIHFDTMAHYNIELIRSTLTSNYRDHAELLRIMMEQMNIHPMVGFLEQRLNRLSSQQNLFSEIADKVVSSRAREVEKQELEVEKRHAKSMEMINVAISFLAIIEIFRTIFELSAAAFNIEDTSILEFGIFSVIFSLFIIIFLIIAYPIIKRPFQKVREKRKIIQKKELIESNMKHKEIKQS